MADVLLHPDVDDQLSDYADDVEERIREKLADAGDDPARYLKRLKGSSKYRLRIGDKRAIIDWDRDAGQLRVLEIGKRDTIYD